MIAQILASKGRDDVPDASRPECGEEFSRAALIGVRGVQVALAIVLLPALATMLVVGGIGAAAAGLVSAVARSAGCGGEADAIRARKECPRV